MTLTRDRHDLAAGGRRRSRRRASALVLALIAAAVMLTIVAALTRASVDEARAAGASAERVTAYYAARAAIWVAGQDLADGGTGDLSGRLDGQEYTKVTGVDADGDGFVDLAPHDPTQVSGTATFESRARDEGDGLYRVRARGVMRGSARLLEAIVSVVRDTPFRFGLFATESVAIRGEATTDGYDSRSLPYLAQPIVGTNGLHLARGLRGHIGADGDVSLEGASAAFGDVVAGGAIRLSTWSRIGGDREVLTNPVRPAHPVWSVPLASDPRLRNGSLGLEHGDPLVVTSGVTVLGPGTYVLSSVHIDSSAVLVLTGGPDDLIEVFVTGSAGVSIIGLAAVEVSPPGPLGPRVVFRVEGPLVVDSDAILNGTRSGLMGDPGQLQLYSRFGSGSAPGVRLGAGTRSSAAIYAPGSPGQLSSTAELFGALVSGRLELSDTPFVHYDEALRDLTPPDATETVVVVALREVR